MINVNAGAFRSGKETLFSQENNKFKLIKNIGLRIGFIALLLLFTRCNFTTQSFNYGKLLNPGETLISTGFGTRQYYSIKWRDSLVNNLNMSCNDTIFKQGFSQSLDYRLGILSKYPLGKGLEIGFHLERPSQFNPSERLGREGSYNGSMVLDFDGRFGFHDFSLGKGLYHHNLSLGWTIGAWIDNGWFAEYAVGWEYKWLIPYANLRVERLGTDPSSDDSLMESYTPFKYQKRAWTTRTVTGISIHLPHLFFLQPDYISPEFSFIIPNYSAISRYGISYQVALRWLNGI
jgi:hypothetical protein